jgi:hypothetical protein
MESHFDDKYQIYIIYNTYDLFHNNDVVRNLLADNWGMKLRGYRKYFPYGVLPIDSYDYLCHHIIIKHKASDKVIMGFKSLTKSNCDRYGYDLPIKQHLINDYGDKYKYHSLAIDQWIAECQNRNQDLAYSTGFTIEPTLPKDEKIFLTDALFYLFYHFYTTYKIPNILQAISIRFKLDERQNDIGFNRIKYKDLILPRIETKKYDDVQSFIMVLDNYGFKDGHIEKSLSIAKLWEKRIEFIGETLDGNQKVAA